MPYSRKRSTIVEYEVFTLSSTKSIPGVSSIFLETEVRGDFAKSDRGYLGNVNDGKKLEEQWRCMTLLLTRVECVIDALVLQTAWGTFAETQGARLALTADAMQVVRPSGHATFCTMHGPSLH